VGTDFWDNQHYATNAFKLGLTYTEPRMFLVVLSMTSLTV